MKFKDAHQSGDAETAVASFYDVKEAKRKAEALSKEAHSAAEEAERAVHRAEARRRKAVKEHAASTLFAVG
jgi:hypothetical protein